MFLSFLFFCSFFKILQTNEKLFPNFKLFFEIFGRKPKIIQKIGEAWILIKLQCVINQWIRFNELYKVMENIFFKFQFRFQIIGWKPKNIQTACILIEVQCIFISMDLTRQTNGFFFRFQNLSN